MQKVVSPGESVEGADKIFSFESIVKEVEGGTISGASGYLDSDAVPSGKVWKITNIEVIDLTSPITSVVLGIYDGSSNYGFWTLLQAIAASQTVTWGGEVWLEYPDVIRATLIGGQAGDSGWVVVTGVQMNAP